MIGLPLSIDLNMSFTNSFPSFFEGKFPSLQVAKFPCFKISNFLTWKNCFISLEWRLYISFTIRLLISFVWRVWNVRDIQICFGFGFVTSLFQFRLCNGLWNYDLELHFVFSFFKFTLNLELKWPRIVDFMFPVHFKLSVFF